MSLSPTPMKPLGGAALFYYGEPMVWLTGSALVMCVLMIIGFVCFIVWRGMMTFWPLDLHEYQLINKDRLAGEIHVHESYEVSSSAFAEMDEDLRQQLSQQMEDGFSERIMLRTCNFDLTGTHFTWFDANLIDHSEQAEWLCFVERMTKKPFIGYPEAFLIDGKDVAAVAATVPAAVSATVGMEIDGSEVDDASHASKEALWEVIEKQIPGIQNRYWQRFALEKHALGALREEEHDARMEMIAIKISDGEESIAYRDAEAHYTSVGVDVEQRAQSVLKDIQDLKSENQRYALRMRTASGDIVEIPGEEIVRMYAPNRLGFLGKLSVYCSRWWEFLSADPRQANSQGGIWPALFGTVVMTLLMTILVVPFGVIAALYMREYAKKGIVLNMVRISINNLAGVPSIVFGIFGLGFFCYIIGDYVDQAFYPAYVHEAMPVFKKGGVLWASCTLALLTLPVVIVATEEALSAVPHSMREGSYGCGASKWQTIRRIVLPRAMPGIMTGMILAMARGAGEVAPLMLVGAVKVAAELPTDPSASFMHLGFHIYDLSYHSQDSEAAMPMAFTTTLVLISIVACLNIVAIQLRNRMNKRFNIQTF